MNRWPLLLVSSLGALLLITAGGWTLGYQPLWAFSFLIYVPLPTRLLLGTLLLLTTLLVSTRSVGMQHPEILWLSPTLDPVAWGWGGDGVTFAVVVRHDGGEETLWSRHLTPTAPPDLDWQEVFLDVSSFAGQSVTLVLVTAPGMTDNTAGYRAGWGLPWLMRGTVDRRFGS